MRNCFCGAPIGPRATFCQRCRWKAKYHRQRQQTPYVRKAEPEESTAQIDAQLAYQDRLKNRRRWAA